MQNFSNCDQDLEVFLQGIITEDEIRLYQYGPVDLITIKPWLPDGSGPLKANVDKA